MKIAGVQHPSQAKMVLMARIMAAPDYSTEKLEAVFSQFLDWLALVEDYGVYEVTLRQALDAYLAMQSAEKFANSVIARRVVA